MVTVNMHIKQLFANKIQISIKFYKVKTIISRNKSLTHITQQHNSYEQLHILMISPNATFCRACSSPVSLFSMHFEVHFQMKNFEVEICKRE